MELDLLGVQLQLALAFRDSGFAPDLRLEDEVTHEALPAEDMFFQVGNRWYMRPESLPGHLGVKAIGADDDALYLETAPLRIDKIQGIAVERMMPFGYDAENSAFIDLTTGRRLVFIGPAERPEVGGVELDPRCLWTFPFAALDDVRRRAVVELADAAFTADAYELPEEEVSVGPVTSQAAVQRISLKVQLNLQQRLQAEQRPVLSLGTEMRREQVQTLELRQILAIDHAIRRMTNEDLVGFFAEYVAKHGEKQALRVAVFALAGKVKSAMPGITWREARRLARKLVHQPAA